MAEGKVVLIVSKKTKTRKNVIDQAPKPDAVHDTAGAGRGRKDGRHQILLYMKPELIADLKAAAIAEDTTAFRLAEKAVAQLLARRRKN